MKKCPYCAEEIQDEAILCRYCHSDLTVPPPMRATAERGTTPETDHDAESPEPGKAEEGRAGFGGGEFGFGAGSAPTTSPSAAQPTSETVESLAHQDPPARGETLGRAETPTRDETPGRAEPSAEVPTPAQAETHQAETHQAADASATAKPTVVTGPVTYTHSGQRYVLGFAPDHFGIWDRQSPNDPIERFPRTDDGWRQAWTRYAAMEPSNVEVRDQAAPPGGQPSSSQPGQGIPGAAVGLAMQYTHSGQRYLLGYGPDFFGIWDRGQLSQPVQRFPRTDAGWRAAWQQFSTWEPHSAEVGIGGKS